MKESAGYQLILEEGEAKGVRNSIREIGAERFGEIPPDAESRLGQIDDLARLQWIRKRLLKASDWNDLLATP